MVAQDEARESFVLPEFVHKMIEMNLLGRKTQNGFYKKDLTPDWQVVIKVIDPRTLEYGEYGKPDFPCLAAASKAKTLPEKMKAVLYGEDKGARFAWQAIAGYLIYSANRIPEISDTLVEIDNAMRWGYNFEMGPFETWDAIGLEASTEKMAKEGLAVPEKVMEMLATGHTAFYKNEAGKRLFYDFASGGYEEIRVSDKVLCLDSLKAADNVAKTCRSASLIDLGDGVFCCEFHTKMNALNLEIIDFIAESLDHVDKQGVGLVVGNQAGGIPGAFSAGADLSMILSYAKDKKYAEIEGFL
jgi:3-hydroxyacyl-CoA dehydrogenase